MFLLQILQQYQARNIATNIETELKNYIYGWCQKCDPEIFISGSRAKQTAISVASDYDYFVSLSSSCNVNQKGIDAISNALHTHLQKKYPNSIRRQNVSTRINISGLNIDITVGTKITGYQNYHWLYKSKDDSKKQTNTKMHIDDISKSGRTNEIKLIKIWRELNGLEFPYPNNFIPSLRDHEYIGDKPSRFTNGKDSYAPQSDYSYFVINFTNADGGYNCPLSNDPRAFYFGSYDEIQKLIQEGKPIKFENCKKVSAIDRVPEISANHKLRPFGEYPVINTVQIEGQEGRAIASSDPTYDEAELIVKLKNSAFVGNMYWDFMVIHFSKGSSKEILKTVSGSLHFL